jgi:hypothetical protein
LAVNIVATPTIACLTHVRRTRRNSAEPAVRCCRSQGGYNVREGFAELIAPIVADRPFFNEVTLEAGIRYSDYAINAPGDPTFDTTTYKVGATWEVIDCPPASWQLPACGQGPEHCGALLADFDCPDQPQLRPVRRRGSAVEPESGRRLPCAGCSVGRLDPGSLGGQA